MFTRVSVELETLAHKAKLLARGQYDVDFTIIGDDEVAQVARSFRDIAGQMDRMQLSLSKAMSIVDESRERAAAAEGAHEMTKQLLADANAEIERLNAEAAAEEPPPSPPPVNTWELRARLLELKLAIYDLDVDAIEAAAVKLEPFGGVCEYGKHIIDIRENAEAGLYQEAMADINKLSFHQ